MERFKTSTLSRLPNELLLLIANCLDDNLDCLRFASCCRQLYAVVLPQVYTTITFKQFCMYSLSVLTHTVLKNPRLARAVRSLTITNEKASLPDSTECHEQSPVIYDSPFITPILEKASESKEHQTEWEDDLWRGENDPCDPWLALMLPFLPNLEYLHMDFVNPPNQLYRMLDRIPHMRKSSSSNLPFGSLTELSMLKLCEDEYVPDTLPFLKLPALRKFSGINLIERSPIRDSDSVSEDEDFEENINEETIDEELAELRAEAAANGEGVQDQGFPLLNDNSGETGSESLGQSAEEDNDNQEDQPLESSRESSPDEDDEDNNWTGFSTVTHLHFRRSNSEINFSRHIRACAKLESFIFEFYNTFLCRQFYPKKLHKALYQHRGTLQELTIVEDEDNRGALDKPELMPSLSEFSALKSLRIRGEILCGRDAMVFPSLADRLPSSLESLYITETEDFNHLLFVDQLAGVASSAHTKFPCLKKVTLEDQSHKYEYRFSSIGVYRYLMPPRPLPSSLIEMCQKAGIEFRLVQVSDFPKLGRNFS